jgi:aminopeptidase N
MFGAMRTCLVAVVVACGAPSTGTPQEAPKWIAETAMPGEAMDLTPPGYRLPGNVRPTRYDLDLTIIPTEPKVSGKIHVDAQVVKPTGVVWLHAVELGITKAALGGVDVKTVQHGDYLGLIAPQLIAAGPLAIDVSFTASIDKTRSRGIYSEKESGPDGEETYAYSVFEALDARRAFPCFDEPEYKVPWKLTFHVKKEHQAHANAKVVREVDEPGGMKRVEIAESKPLPSYLVAFVVGPFEIVDGGVAGRIKTPIRFLIPKGRSAELAYAKSTTPKVVAALENYFDMDYPYGKLDVAVVPRFWGTMEHPGIVAMGQPLTLIRPGDETRERRRSYVNILAHELAHYWFGDLVTMKWWDDVWLNEALGQWVDVIITDAAEPEWRYRDVRVSMSNNAMEADETLASNAIRRPVQTSEEIQASFDGAITYEKGASVFRMFEALAGPAKWQAMIRAYMKKFAWGNASADDFLGVVKDSLGPDVETGLRSFLEQPGVPRIGITCDVQDQSLRVTQTRSLPAGTVDPKPKTWRLPVCMRFGDAKQSSEQCLWLEDADSKLPLVNTPCPTWLIPNARADGYYRSAADPALLAQLLTPGSPIAKIARPSTAEKVMLIIDLSAAIARNEIEIDKVLAVVPQIVADPDDRVARTAFGVGAFRADALIDDALYGKARSFALKAFGPSARKLGWKRDARDSDERHERRKSVLEAVGGLEPTLALQAVKLADEWLARRTGVADDLVPVMLAVAVNRGGAKRFDQVLEAARKPRDRVEQRRLLEALGAAQEPVLARRAFELVRSKEFDLRDSMGIVYGLLFMRETRALALELVTAHLDELLGRLAHDEASWFLGALAGGSCDAKTRAQIAALVTPRAAKINGAQLTVERGLEKTDQCIASFARQLPALRRFLSKY